MSPPPFAATASMRHPAAADLSKLHLAKESAAVEGGGAAMRRTAATPAGHLMQESAMDSPPSLACCFLRRRRGRLEIGQMRGEQRRLGRRRVLSGVSKRKPKGASWDRRRARMGWGNKNTRKWRCFVGRSGQKRKSCGLLAPWRLLRPVGRSARPGRPREVLARRRRRGFWFGCGGWTDGTCCAVVFGVETALGISYAPSRGFWHVQPVLISQLHVIHSVLLLFDQFS